MSLEENYADEFEKNQGWNFDDSFDAPNTGSRVDWSPSRFYIGEEQLNKPIYLSLLDDDPQKILEHELTIGGTWNNRFVCPQMFGERCYLCEEVEVRNYDDTEWVDETPYNLWLLSIINHTGWDDDGQQRKHVKQVLPMKRSAAKLVRGKMDEVRDQGDDPVFFKFKVKRTSKNKSRIGDDWNLEGPGSKQAFKETVEKDVDLSPFNWKETIEVKDYEEQKRIYETSGGSDSPDEVLEEVDTDAEVNGSADKNKDFFDDDNDSENTAENSSSGSSTESSDSEEESLVTYE